MTPSPIDVESRAQVTEVPPAQDVAELPHLCQTAATDTSVAEPENLPSHVEERDPAVNAESAAVVKEQPRPVITEPTGHAAPLPIAARRKAVSIDKKRSGAPPVVAERSEPPLLISLLSARPGRQFTRVQLATGCAVIGVVALAFSGSQSGAALLQPGKLCPRSPLR